MKVAITMPAYNEEPTLAAVLQGIKTEMSATKHDYFLVVVDDGSTDKTVQIAKELGALVVSHPYNYGLAEAFRTEIKTCLAHKADIIIHTDADGQYPAEDIPLLLTEIESGGADLVLGSRFAGHIEEMPPMKRLGNMAFSKVISHITGVRITDGQTGFRAFTKDVAALNIISNHTYTQEQIIRAVRNKYKVKEIPIRARKTRPSRLMRAHPALQPFEYAAKAWINIFRLYRDFEPLKFFGYIGTAFLLTGLAIGFWLFYLFITTARIGHMPSTILSMLLIVASIQIWLFGFLADMQKK